MREDTLVMVLQQFPQSLKKSVRQYASEIGISKSHSHWVLKNAMWKRYMPELLHGVNDDNPNTDLSFVNGFRGRWMRMHSLWT
jgi:hypothetical protein